MKTSDFTTTLLVDQTPEEIFNSIINLRGWWSEEIEGNTDKLNDEFLYHYKDIHICKIKTLELIPGKKVYGLFRKTISVSLRTKPNGKIRNSVLKFLKRITRLNLFSLT